MSELINDGGSAFPFGKKNFTDDWSHGMSLRDWFAGQALTGLISGALTNADRLGEVRAYTVKSYELADAMLAARKEKK
jgi:hypothetical protein